MNKFNKRDVEKLISYFNSDQFFNVTNDKDKANLMKEFLDFKRLYERNELEADAYNLAEKFIVYGEQWSKKNPTFLEAYNKIYKRVFEKVAVR